MGHDTVTPLSPPHHGLASLSLSRLMGLGGRRRRWIVLLTAAGLSGYGAYRTYHHPTVARRRRELLSLLRALISIANAAAASAEAVTIVTSDLNLFLRSDSDEMPQSLRQLAKIASSDEFSNSVSKLLATLTIGIIKGAQTGFSKSGSEPSFSDRLIDKLFSAEGTGFASAVVGSFARNLVLAFYSGDDNTAGTSSDSPATSKWVRLICRDECRKHVADCVQRFVSAAVTVYLEKTTGVNGYDQLFAGLTNPKHEAQVKEMIVSVSNGAVETLVRASHRLLSHSNSISSAEKIKDCKQEDEFHCPRDNNNLFSEEGRGNGRWVDRVSSTLGVRSNSKFVLSVTGRVTFNTVMSLLGFLLWNLYDRVARSIKVVCEEMVEKCLEVVRQVSAKSMSIVTMCLTVLVGTRFLLPA